MESLENKTKKELLDLLAEQRNTIEKLEAETAALAEEITKFEEKNCDGIVEKLIAEKSGLLELLKVTCDNNCPHHHAPEACKNCSVEKRVKEICG